MRTFESSSDDQGQYEGEREREREGEKQREIETDSRERERESAQELNTLNQVRSKSSQFPFKSLEILSTAMSEPLMLLMTQGQSYSTKRKRTSAVDI